MYLGNSGRTTFKPLPELWSGRIKAIAFLLILAVFIARHYHIAHPAGIKMSPLVEAMQITRIKNQSFSFSL